VQANYNSGAAGTWKKLGPYQAAIADGTINSATTGGAANFSGVEVWKVNAPVARIAAAEQETRAIVGQLSLYPNPVTDKFTVTLPFPAAEVQETTVTDAAGKVHLVNGHRVAGQDQLAIPVTQLQKGFYLLTLDTDQGSKVLKFFKQ
jgi:hypothetical protein